MKILLALTLLSGCVSVWPEQCKLSWRAKTACTCARTTIHVVKKQRVYIECDGATLPIEISGTVD